VQKDIGISLLLNLPHGEQGKGRQALAMWAYTLDHRRSPILNARTGPVSWVDIMEAKPLFEELPNSNGEAEMHKEMVVGFLGLLANGAFFSKLYALIYQRNL
jgi:hypothetical protein